MEISDALWDAIELMSREMSVDRDALVNQALFTFARFNGYVTPGAVAPHTKAEPAAAAPIAQPLASPPSAQRRTAEPAPAPAPAAAAEPAAAAPRPVPVQAPASAASRPAPVVSAAVPTPTTAEAETTDPNGARLASASPAAASRVEPELLALQTGAIPTSLLVRPGPPQVTGLAPAVAEEDTSDPPDDHELDDGLDELPENGQVEWQVPRWILANRRVAKVSGTVKGRDFTGSVTRFDGAGAIVDTLELGLPVDDERVEQALVPEKRDARSWKQLSQELSGAGHIGAATLALCRSIGSGEPLVTLERWLEQHTLRRQSRAANERAEKAHHVLSNMHRFGAAPARKASYLVEELLQGAEPSAILRELAIDQDQYASSRAAADLIVCAKALDPEHAAHYAYTQALIAMSLGDPDTARVCADQLRDASEAQANFLTTYLNGLFPTYDFWPARDAISSFAIEVEAKPSPRKLADFRNAIQKTALRVKQLRSLLEPLIPAGTSWLIPSVDTLLSRGKATLEAGEGLGLEDWQERNIPQLLRRCRAEWARLCWLCWLAGLDLVGLPSATTKPRSPTALRQAWAMRAHLFELIGGETPLEQGFDADDLIVAKKLAALKYLDVPTEALDAPNASELGVPEAAEVMQAINWATELTVRSPIADLADEADTPDEPAPPADAPADPPAPSAPAAAPIQTPREQEAVHAPALSALSAPAGASGTAIQPAVSVPVTEPEPEPSAEGGERTAIVKPVGRKLWVQREGHDTIELVGMRFTVGRDPRCEIMIASPRVSREHAAILVDAENVLVTDLNSSNGTFFNGERVMRHAVNDGDVVQFGNEKVKFCFTDPAMA